jgi:hypothetical protein
MEAVAGGRRSLTWQRWPLCFAEVPHRFIWAVSTYRKIQPPSAMGAALLCACVTPTHCAVLSNATPGSHLPPFPAGCGARAKKKGGGRQVAASGIGIISKRSDNRNASAVATSLSHIVVNDQYHSLLSAVGHVWGAAWSRGRDRRTVSRSCLRGGWGQNRVRWLCANPPRQIFIKFLLREFLVKFCEVETA